MAYSIGRCEKVESLAGYTGLMKQEWTKRNNDGNRMERKNVNKLISMGKKINVNK